MNHVALFATPATVASRAFQRELAFRAIGVDVEAQACGGVVDAIEEGDMILAEALVRSHVDALKRKMPNPEAAILGCTHYPLMEDGLPGCAGAGGARSTARPASWPKALPTTSPATRRWSGAGTRLEVPHHRRSGQGQRPATQFLRRKITFRSGLIAPRLPPIRPIS